MLRAGRGLVADVAVGDPGCFEQEADVFAAAGEAGVVEEFVGGVRAGFFCGGVGGHGGVEQSVAWTEVEWVGSCCLG